MKWFSTFYREPGYAGLAPIFEDRPFLRAYWYDATYDPSDSR